MKNVIVTGAYGTIGKEIAKGLFSSNFNLCLVGRDEGKLLELKREFRLTNSKTNIQISCVDLSNKIGIFTFANSIHNNIDVLINNAATAPKNRIENQLGIEMQWATNVLGYYWMIMAFKNHLLDSENPRVVNVASYWAGGLNLDDPEFKSRTYNNDIAYRQSKQADRMLTYGLADAYKDKISMNACHPGDANSKLSNDLGFGGSESAKRAAYTPLILATTVLGVENSGKYFEHGKLSSCRFKGQKSEIKKLLELCEHY
jgi:NAD(P)-dependent dehydrogenase (short-subunit alcohol dehydrogenase family)